MHYSYKHTQFSATFILFMDINSEKTTKENSPEICAVIQSGRDALENFLAKVPISALTYLYDYLP